MKLGRLRKIYYIFLFLFFSLLISSYGSIAHGGVILWSGPGIFYITTFLVVVSLFYVIATARSDSFSWIEAVAIGAFCLSLFSVVWVGSGSLPYDFDSILYMHSISFTLQNGFSPNLANNPNFLINAPYALPMQSILGAALVLVTNSSYATVAKYLPLLLIFIFLVIYYTLVSEKFSKSVALLSLAALASFSFVIANANTFNNIDLGTIFFLLSLSLVFMRNSSNRLVFTVLAFFVIACFVLTHHLTLVLLVAALAVLAVSDQIISRRYPEFNLRSENVAVIFVVAVVAVFSYYAFVYFSPLQIILSTFTNQLANEVASAQPVSGWSFPVLLQRAFYILFIGFSVILAVFLARANLRRFLSRFADFFLLGSTFFVFAVAGQLIKAPYNWDMISIFGWFFFIPVTLAMVFACMDLPIPARRGILLFVSAVLVAALVFGNVYALPTNVLDHTGANEYQGGRFKNWAKPQEFNSVLWTIHYKNSGSQIVGDELVRRLYLSNSPNFTGNFKFIQFYNATSRDSVILIRNENSYQIIPFLYPAKGMQGGPLRANESITNLLSNQSLIRVYDDAEVRILSSPAP